MRSWAHPLSASAAFAFVAATSCVEIPFVTETFADELAVGGVGGPVTVGDTARLTASALYRIAASDPVYRYSSTLYPQDYTWKALDPAIASVDSLGVVRGIVAGAARISTTYRTVTDTVGVLVIPLVNAVALSATSATVAVNDTASFDATALDSQQQPIPSVPLEASVSVAIVHGVVLPVSATVTRFKYVSKGQGEFIVTVRVPNARADRVRTATFTLTATP
jgi:hypothetical protein